jgi:hypothetical protein
VSIAVKHRNRMAGLVMNSYTYQLVGEWEDCKYCKSGIAHLPLAHGARRICRGLSSSSVKYRIEGFTVVVEEDCGAWVNKQLKMIALLNQQQAGISSDAHLDALSSTLLDINLARMSPKAFGVMAEAANRLADESDCVKDDPEAKEWLRKLLLRSFVLNSSVIDDFHLIPLLEEEVFPKG